MTGVITGVIMVLITLSVSLCLSLCLSVSLSSLSLSELSSVSLYTGGVCVVVFMVYTHVDGLEHCACVY